MTRGVKTKLTEEQWKEMGEYALDGCQTGTIAALMDLPDRTLRDNKDIRKFLHKKRAERKQLLRKAQRKQLGTPAMAIFLGKNELEQSDRQDHRLNVKFEEISVNIG